MPRFAPPRSLYLYDDRVARGFEPFALTRPISELRVGAELIRRRWERAFNMPAAGFIAAPHLATFEEPGAPPAAPEILPAGSIVANARAVVALGERLSPEHAEWWSVGEASSFPSREPAAVRLHRDVETARLADGVQGLHGLLRDPSSPDEPHDAPNLVQMVPGRWLDEVWHPIAQLTPQLTEDILALGPSLDTADHGAVVLGAHPVFVERGATVEPYVVFDASAGPVLVRAGATVQSFTRVVGPTYVGEGSTVVGEIRGCSIGDTCKVHGEISASIVLGHANKGHDGFVGHSYLGRWVNLGAGTTTSNLKNTYGTVALWTPDGVRDTKQQFLGTLFGDHVKTGIGLRLTTGTVLGAGANVYDTMPPKVAPPLAWGGGAPYGRYDVEKFLAVAERAMARRHVALGDGGRAVLRAAAEIAESGRSIGRYDPVAG